ncbi:hypothetical protein [Streptomyces agglomeratus]|uniref:hypothetical protein n=1 Tax=Streptomyces agglomeratus TaxID=285458 RepID=UPI001F0A7AE7|nr:hypothetical protein [Streptomyces agglomeratus]
MTAPGLVAALLAADPTQPGQEWTIHVPERLVAVLATMPVPARAGVRVAAAAVDGYALAPTGRTLATLTPREREYVVTCLAGHRRLAPLLELLKVPVLLAAGTERMFHQPPSTPPIAPPDPPLNCVPAEEWPTRSTASTDTAAPPPPSAGPRCFCPPAALLAAPPS